MEAGAMGQLAVPAEPKEPKPKKKRAIDINMEYSNPKTELTSFCQLKKGKSMDKGDIVYETSPAAGGFQTTVTLAAVDNKQFAGEVCADKKLAEWSAATVALKEHEVEILEYNLGAEPHVPRAPKPGKPPKAPKMPKPMKPGEEPCPATESMTQALTALLEREPTETDYFYATEGMEDSETG